MKKRALILALAGIMAASLTGCGSLKDDAVVVKAGDEEITAGVANFYARYTQAQYETYFASFARYHGSRQVDMHACPFGSLLRVN